MDLREQRPNFRSRSEAQRIAARDKVEFECEVGGTQGACLGQVRDITEDGCRIVCPHQYSEGDMLAVTFLIPSFSQRFDFVAKVMRVDFAADGKLYEFGCKLIHTPSSRKLLKELIWQLHQGNVPEIQRKPDGKSTTRHIKKLR
jgi:hypothetical protein